MLLRRHWLCGQLVHRALSAVTPEIFQRQVSGGGVKIRTKRTSLGFEIVRLLDQPQETVMRHILGGY